MGLAAAAAGKRKTAAVSYTGAGDDDDDDEYEHDDNDEEEEYKAPAKASKASKATPTAATAASSKTKAVTAPSAKKPKLAATERKDCLAKVAVLDRSQLQGLLKSLLEAGTVEPAEIEALLPAPDMSTYVKEGERLSAQIRKALPRSRYGSSTDHYGYKRCASAANACKKYIVDHAKTFKQAKQWQDAREYAACMLPVAYGMIDFDLPEDCKQRNSTIETLTALRAEADGKLGLSSTTTPAGSTPAAPAMPAAVMPVLGFTVD